MYFRHRADVPCPRLLHPGLGNEKFGREINGERIYDFRSRNMEKLKRPHAVDR
jgi:hypothetical protein